MKTDRNGGGWSWRLLGVLAATLAGLPGAWAQPANPPPGDVVSAVVPPTLFSFRAENVPIRQALTMFARANQLNIVPDHDVVGDVTVEFNNLPLDLAMRALLEASGYYMVKDGALLRVRNRETRLFHVDYINTTRAGEGLSAVQISSSGSGGGGGGAGGGGGGGGSGGEQGSSMIVSATATLDFWGGLATQLQALVGEAGSVTINSLAGTILVSTSHRQMLDVANYLESVTGSVLRQIDLEVQIFEVALSHADQLGINWTFVSDYLYGMSFSTMPDATPGSSFPAGGLIIRNPVFGPALPAPVIQDRFSHNGLDAVIEALRQQGTLKIVSKPRLRTLNNQPAVVRVGQDLPVFTRQVTQSPGNPPVITETEYVQNVTVGTVLSITPQVSADGLITLDLTPAVSRLVRIDTSASGDTSAPVIDIRQASSIVRLRDGDTVVMGGLVQEGEYMTERKVPFLGDIPVVGKVFSSHARTQERTELVFFLTPKIVPEHAATP